jgi:23S rRNA-/tRNA-specific pseudouridylate synthase
MQEQLSVLYENNHCLAIAKPAGARGGGDKGDDQRLLLGRDPPDGHYRGAIETVGPLF